ncbi:hypothetical protein CPR19088_GLDEOEPO_00855 [Companilactobacillus paralimentarius]
MNLSKSASIIAALAMASTAGLIFTQKQADASTIATITTNGPATLYDINGNAITNRALSPNSKWAVGSIFVSGDKAIYQVSTNEYLRSTEANLTGDYAYLQPNKSAASAKLTGKIINGTTTLYRDDTNSMSNRMLANGSNWAIGKHYLNKNGDDFFQVSTHEYVNGKHLSLNHAPEQTIYSANFGISGAHVDTDDETNTSNNNNNDNNWSNIGTDNNSNVVNTNNNTNTNVDTNTNNNNTSTDTATYKPNVANINKYFVAYLNALHKANGTAPVHSTDHLMSYAQQRAEQQNGNNLDHSTATEDDSENLSSAGFNYMNYVGVKSDKDAAYFLLKDWYDEDNNYAAIGQEGHFGHRAALIYSGPEVGLGITDSDAAFDANWNMAQNDQFLQIYNYTGSNPNTKFISKDSI